MKFFIDECYELEGDFQNQFLGNEVFPQPNYKKMRLSKRTINNVRYNDIYILESLHYYYVTLDKNIEDLDINKIEISNHYANNGLLTYLDIKKNKMFIFNASQNFVCLQKGTIIGEVVL